MRGIMDMRDRWGSEAKEIVLPFPVELPLNDVEISVPMRGDKRQLLSLSELKTFHFVLSKIKPSDTVNTLYTFTINDYCKVLGIEVNNGKRSILFRCFF